jgi:hypothetical protein
MFARFSVDDVGCVVDGARGHQAIRARLAGMLEGLAATVFHTPDKELERFEYQSRICCWPN